MPKKKNITTVTIDRSFGTVPYFVSSKGTIKFLLIHQQKGHWAFPKGHKEGKESDLETALRETIEETNVDFKYIHQDHSFSEQYVFTNSNKQIIKKTVVYYPVSVKTTKVTIQPQEVQAYTWATYEEALEKLTFSEAKKILTKVNKLISSFID